MPRLEGSDGRQGDLFGSSPPLQDPDSARALIDQLIADTELYTTREDFKRLLASVARLRPFAPFNAMLLHIQKPGLTHAATARDWRSRFDRKPKRHARPLVVLRAIVTLAHELAHLFLGHLGPDEGRNVPDRRDRSHALRQVEAETAAYLVAKRNGITPRSETYLQHYRGALKALDIYAVMRAANEIEKVFGISAHTLWNGRGAGLGTGWPSSGVNL